MFKPILIIICVLFWGVANKALSQKMQPCRTVNNAGSVSMSLESSGDAPLIHKKPDFVFPPALRHKLTVGSVSLKVTFLANGRIGRITVVQGLEKDLDEQVVKAARKIRFVPAKKNGKSVTVTKTVDYQFYDRRRCLPVDRKKTL